QGWVLAHLVGVIQAGFLIRQWGVLSPGIWQDAEALVVKALVIKGLKRPDDRFHVVRIHRLVAVFEIYPTSLAGNVFFPLIGVAQHRRSTVLIEVLQTHIVDLALIGDSELLFCFLLRWQTVAVPAKDARYVVSRHGAVARYDVFNITGQLVTIVRQAISKRRTIIEDVFWVAFALF